MQLVPKDEYCRGTDVTSVAETVEAQLSHRVAIADDINEATAYAVGESTVFLGRLVALLHDKGVLTDEDILELLPAYERHDQ